MVTSYNHLKCAVVFASCLVGLSMAQLARADATFNVDSTLDQVDDHPGDGICHTAANKCTLRAAAMEVSSAVDPGAVTTVVLPAGVYQLTIRGPDCCGAGAAGALFFNRIGRETTLLSLQGEGAATTIIEGNSSDSVIEIEGIAVSISNVTVRNGHGGVVNGILRGGGIDVFGQANLTIDRCTIEGNISDSCGGGIAAPYAQLFIIRSTISNNRAGNGGGLCAGGGIARSATIQQSALINNHASGDGGGIINFAGPPLFVVNSTISGNTANANGGGLSNLGTTWLYSTSIINNDASHDRNPPGGSGGGVYNQPGARLVATNSLIAGNTTLDAPLPDDCNGVLEVYGWNLLADDGSCTFSGNGIAARGQVSTNTIGPLASNGGPTMTHALLVGSEAIDTTTAQGCVGPTLALLATDQRGAPRIAGAKCDVGAYEYGSVVPATDVIFSNGFD